MSFQTIAEGLMVFADDFLHFLKIKKVQEIANQIWGIKLFPAHTVKPCPEAYMDMILFEVFLKSIDLIPQQQILQWHYLYYR